MQQVFAQVGAFSDRENAMKLISALEAGGLYTAFVQSENGSTGLLHRVRIGPLAGVDAYDEVVEVLATLGLKESLLIVER